MFIHNKYLVKVFHLQYLQPCLPLSLFHLSTKQILTFSGLSQNPILHTLTLSSYILSITEDLWFYLLNVFWIYPFLSIPIGISLLQVTITSDIHGGNSFQISFPVSSFPRQSPYSNLHAI